MTDLLLLAQSVSSPLILGAVAVVGLAVLVVGAAIVAVFASASRKK